MAARKAPNSIETAKGTVVVEESATYKITLAKAVSHLGHVMRPSDRNIKVSGAALIAIAKEAAEGAIADAEAV